LKVQIFANALCCSQTYPPGFKKSQQAKLVTRTVGRFGRQTISRALTPRPIHPSHHKRGQYCAGRQSQHDNAAVRVIGGPLERSGFQDRSTIRHHPLAVPGNHLTRVRTFSSGKDINCAGNWIFRPSGLRAHQCASPSAPRRSQPSGLRRNSEPLHPAEP